MPAALHEESFADLAQGPAARRLAIATPYLHRMQRRHFILFNVLPLLGTIAALALAAVRPIGALEWTLFFSMWLLTGLGVSAGFHRHFTHRAFKAPTPVRVTLAVFGSMAGLGPLISWAAMHRRHHQCADRDGDMHSPNLHGTDSAGRLRGFLHAHITWMVKHEYPNIAHYATDLIEEPAIRRVSRHYLSWAMLGLLAPALIGGVVTSEVWGAVTGLLWGGFVRMFVVAQSISALNSFSHTIGSRPFRARDNSRNNLLLGLLVWGEGWHHNHHAFPRSASFGLRWYYADLSYWFILLLERLGLASDLKVPTSAQIAARHAELIPAVAPGVSTQAE